MKYTTFISQLQKERYVEIPVEVRDKLDLRNGDKLEITIRKIKARRLEILISENPLYKLLKISKE